MIAPIITPWVSLAQLDSVAEGVFDEAIRQDESRAFLKDPSHIMMLAMEDELVVGMASGVVIRHPDKLRELWINEVEWRIVHEATDLLNDWCRVCLIGPLGETFAQPGSIWMQIIRRRPGVMRRWTCRAFSARGDAGVVAMARGVRQA